MNLLKKLLGEPSPASDAIPPERRLREVVGGLNWANDEFWHWLGRQDAAKVPEAQWLPPVLREWVHTHKLSALLGKSDSVELDGDFWHWFRARQREGLAHSSWLPPPLQEQYFEKRWQDFVAEKRDMTRPPHRLFHDVDDDFWFWMLTEGCRRHPELQGILPGMADPQVAERFVGSSGDETLREGFMAYQLFKKAFEDYVGPIHTCAGILDSGVGWGRVIRFFLKDLDPGRLWGVDPHPEGLEICRRTNRWCRFAEIDYLPPVDCADGTFDLVYLYSVFSHLSEPAHQRWLTEFHRVLRPGGLLIATTWHREFIEWVAKVRSDPNEPCTPAHWRDCMQDIFLDTKQTLADYDAGKFCFGEFDQNKMQSFICEGINSYGDACIPKGYVEKHWADRFALLEYVDDRARCPQNAIIARRK